MSTNNKKKYYGWGDINVKYPLDNKFLAYLNKELNMKKAKAFGTCDLKEIKIHDSKISTAVKNEFIDIVGAEFVADDQETRILNSFGKSYKDLIRIRKGALGLACDIVIYPKSTEETLKIVQKAYENNLNIITRGGGSSVLSGVNPIISPTIILNLDYLDRILEIDKHSQVVRAYAGILGPMLEEELNAEGYTLGHFPQSFEYSSLGGWIASKSAGQFSSFYGNIEDLVSSLKVVNPMGVFESKQIPSSAAGPCLKDLFIGSEGAFGVITEATMKIRKLPEKMDFSGVYFSTFEAGINASREMYQGGIKPLLLRLSDVKETEVFFKLGLIAHGMKDWFKKSAGKLYFKAKGWHEGEGAIMMLGFLSNDPNKKAAFSVIKNYSGINLGETIGKNWYKDRFKHPYLRDSLINKRFFVDTFETATNWKNIDPLYRNIEEAINDEFSKMGLKCIVLTHLSHLYIEGSSLYFTVLAPQIEGQEIRQWEDVKKTITNTIMKFGGTLSHHHGVGQDHMPWINEELGDVGMEMLKALKNTLDPKGLLNPGVLVG
ncbi:MAG: FAD-binding oxidoreductase [Pseudomonadota bacterium]